MFPFFKMTQMDLILHLIPDFGNPPAISSIFVKLESFHRTLPRNSYLRFRTTFHDH